jgi:hypothetical protein
MSLNRITLYFKLKQDHKEMELNFQKIEVDMDIYRPHLFAKGQHCNARGVLLLDH